MAGHRSKYFPLIAICIDVILLFNAFVTAALIVFRGSFPHPVFYWKLFSVWVLLWIVIAIQLKLFDLPRIFYTDRTVLKNIQALLVFTVLSAALIYFVADYQFSKLYFILAISLFGIMLLTWHLMLTVLFKAYRKKGNNYRNIVLVGFNEQVEYLTREVLLQPENGYRISGIFGGACPEDLRRYHKGTEAAVLEHIAEGGVDEMLISLPAEQSDLMNTFLSYADNHLIRARILPHFSGYLFQKFSLEYVLNLPVMELRREPLESLSNRIVKRVFDIGFSASVLLFVGCWLFPVIALLIKLTSRGPVFFIQERSGKEGIPFNCIKFRTMRLNSDSNKKQTTRDDARITPVGAFLRRTSLDEMPQFLNVLMNDMSVVGPRPHMTVHTEAYQRIVDKYMVRHFAKPGISGWAQIQGFRGEIKEDRDIINRAEADIWYIENWNIFLDIKIIVLTLWQVIFKKEKNAF